MITLSEESVLIIYAALGIILGLTLERGRICFVSAFRDVFMFKNPWLLNGILISIGSTAIATGLLSDYLGVRPIMLGTSWLVIIGGLIFGLGVSLAGACASGMLFRIPEGYVANILELVGFSSGVLLWAEFLESPLSHMYSSPISIYSILGLRADIYSLLTGGAFIIAGLYLNKFVPKKTPMKKSGGKSRWTLDPRRAWDPRIAGLILAGIVSVMFVVTPTSLLGFTAPYATLGAWTLSAVGINMKSVPWVGQWYLGVYPLLVLTICAFVGAALGAGAGRNFRVRIPKSKTRLIQGTLGGLLAGLGAGIGLGCNIGNFFVGFGERMDLAAALFAPGLMLGIYLGFKIDSLLVSRDFKKIESRAVPKEPVSH
jgi:uncharacterized protein